jgi:hypothetical protein
VQNDVLDRITINGLAMILRIAAEEQAVSQKTTRAFIV